jgi:hypothetical protein
MGAPDSPVRQRCANGRLQWLVLTASRWADGTPDSPLKFNSRTTRSQVSARREPSSLGQAGPTDRGCTGQSGAPKPETLVSVLCCFFNSVFVLTCEYVLEWHLALYVSVNMHQHYTRTLLVKLLIDNPSL